MEQRGIERDNFLDCIRALAITLVFFQHDAGALPNGTVGVSVFFALSGYLICGMLLPLERSPGNALRFIFRRLARVWPMMAFQIALTALLLWIFVPDRVVFFLHDVPRLLTFRGGYTEWNGLAPAILWTLMAEFWFYVLFAIIWLACPTRLLFAPILSGIALGAYCKAALGHEGIEFLKLGAFAPLHFTLVYLDQLMFGAACAWLVRFQPEIVTAFRNRAFLWLPLAAIALIAVFQANPTEPLFYVNTSAAALLTAIAILHNSANHVRGDLEPIATLGRISYSIYLLHAVAFDFLPQSQIPALTFESVAAATIIASLATYRWVEMPFIKMSKRLAPFAALPIRSDAVI